MWRSVYTSDFEALGARQLLQHLQELGIGGDGWQGLPWHCEGENFSEMYASRSDFFAVFRIWRDGQIAVLRQLRCTSKDWRWLYFRSLEDVCQYASVVLHAGYHALEPLYGHDWPEGRLLMEPSPNRF
jgi:hypothetical protein